MTPIKAITKIVITNLGLKVENIKFKSEYTVYEYNQSELIDETCTRIS